MKCPKCNEEIANKIKFCTKCGANIEEELKNKTEKMEKKLDVKENKKEKQLEKNKENKTENKDEKRFNKKEPKPKKNHTGIKIIFALIIILAILIAGIYGLYKVDALPETANEFVTPIFETVEEWLGKTEKSEEDEEEKDSKEVQENEITNKEEKEELSKLDNNKDLVYDYYTTKINNVTSRIPQINLDCDNVDKINNEIKGLLEEDIKELEKSTDMNSQILGLIGTDYRWYENEDVLSLVIAIKYDTGVSKYVVYNINTKDGQDVENSEILKIAKVSENDFPNMAQKAVENVFDKMFDKTDVNITSATAYTAARDKTIDKTNFSIKKTDMFLNDDGELSIIAEITTLAGAGYTYKIVSIEENSSSTMTNTNTSNNTNVLNNTNN